MAGWYHHCNDMDLGTLREMVKEQEGLVCCSPWGCKESDMTGRLNNNNIYICVCVCACVCVCVYRDRFF